MSDKNKSSIEVSPGHGFSQIYNDLNSRTMPTATPMIIILIIVVFAYFLFNSLGVQQFKEAKAEVWIL